ncbi:hypothetical protein A0J61_06518 [Choanephora cucurbitarum]|uniref:Uncharacterized protein n=1 Tax=Choanephora cucurbitarum TaxID=101091 RepID=A0A1C7N9U4_9FUNG|nr:hypothetical protein A0J61_06518 [Choanephora cucurbitarum]
MDNIVFEDSLGKKNDAQGSRVIEFELEASNEMYPVEEKGMSARGAAIQLRISVRTTSNWVKKDSIASQDYTERASGSGKLVGRPPNLTEEHGEFMVDWAGNNTNSVVLDDMLVALTEKFGKI